MSSGLWDSIKSAGASIKSPLADKLHKLVAEQGVPILVELMESEQKREDEATQLEGTRALLGLTFDAEMQQRIVAGGGVPVLLRVMRSFPKNRELTMLALVAVQHLTTTPSGKAALLEASATRLVGEVITEHLKDVAIQIPAWRAMANFLLDGTQTRAVLAEGGIARALAAMEAHAGDVHVQEAAGGALSALAGEAANDAVAAGGVEAVLATLRRHTNSTDPDAPRALCYALAGLTRMCSLCAAAPGRASTEDAAKLVFKAMAHFPEEAELQLRGVAAQWSLFIDAANVAEAAACGALNAVVAAMAAQPGSAETQMWGCHALARAAMHNAPSVVRAGGVRACEGALAAAKEYEFPAAIFEPLVMSAHLVAGLANPGAAPKPPK